MKKSVSVATTKNGTRSLLMSGLIVAAITGVAPAWAADNMSVVDGKNVTVTGAAAANGVNSASALSVTNGGLYIGSGASYLVVSGNAGDTAHKGLATVGNGGKIHVGNNAAGTAAGAGTLTVDNMTIDGNGAEVLVSDGSTLDVVGTDGTININNGALTLNQGTVNVVKEVNIASKGTLQATGGTQNLVNAPTVNLNGGTIYVAKDAAMTFGSTVAASNIGHSQYGTLHVVTGNTLNSTGGTIKAHVNQNGGTINYNSGTTTVDNMTIADGTSVIANGATLSITQDNPLITGATSILEMQGGTLSIAGGEGTLLVQNGGELLASAGDNTVNGSVNTNDGGKLTVGPTDGTPASLTITKNLTVGDGTLTVGTAGTNKESHQLTVLGTTTSDGTITVGQTGKLTVKTSDFVTGEGSSAGSGWTKKVGGTVANDGVIYLTGYSGKYWQNDLGGIQDALTGGTGGSNENIALVGGDLQDTEVGSNSSIKAPTNGLQVSDGGNLSGNLEAESLQYLVDPTDPAGLQITGTTQLNGAGGTNLLTDKNGKALDFTVTGTLQLGNSAIAAAVPNQGGSLANVTASGGTIGVAVGAYTAQSMTLNANSALTISDSGELALDKLTSDGTSTITVGNATSNGTLVADNVQLKGSTIIFDPDWSGTSNPSLSEASQGALSFTNNTVDGLLDVRQQSLLTLGSTDKTWLADRVQKVGGWGPDGTQAALGIFAPLTLDGTNGGIRVDGSLNSAATPPAVTPGDVILDNDTLFVANLDGVDSTGNGTPGLADALVTGNGGNVVIGTVIPGGVDPDSNTKLYVENLKKGQYRLFDGFASVTGGFTDIINPDRMLNPTFVGDGSADAGTLFVARNSATSVFPGLSGALGDVVNQVWDRRKNNVDSGNAGIRFVSRAANDNYIGGGREGARTLEGAARMAVAGAAPGVTLDASRAATTAATTRTSFASPLLNNGGTAVAMIKDEATNQWQAENGISAGDGVKNGAALWIMPLYQNSNVWGMKADDFKTGYSSNMGGVALGGDYTFNDAFRVGLALNLGGGYAQSSGDFNSTDNSFNFWGINLYGGWTQNNFGITADVGYTSVFNDIEQDMSSGMSMGNLKADVNSSIWTAGLRAEYKIQTSVMDIIPHLSARYTGLNINSFDVKSGGTVFETEESNQSIWTFPIGVTLSKDIETGSGWKFKPQLDLAVVPAAGDVKTKSKVKIPGMGTTADLSTQVVDYVTFDGGLGFEVQKDNVSFGLNYNIQASEHRTGHGVFGTFRYEF